MTHPGDHCRYRSQMPGVVWPAVPSPSVAITLALTLEMEDSQWWPAERLRAAQWTQLHSLLTHCATQVPFYGQRLAGWGWTPGEHFTAEDWLRLPILTRADVVDAGDSLHARQCPPEHGPVHEVRTTGTTGPVVRLRRTALALRMLYALSLRYHRWHRHDLNCDVATIRHYLQDPPRPPWGQRMTDWGDPVAGPFHTGAAWALDVHTSTSEQLAWLQQVAPGHLVTLPSVVLALAETCLERGIQLPSLRQVRTLGETLPENLRQTVAEAWGVGVTDTYSCNEVGHLALQIPGDTRYFVPEEHVFLEVLDDAGNPVAPGASGRVVVTSLCNFATPLVRYELGDYVELGEPSRCGRGLRVLNAIRGRSRQLLRLPTGESRFASFGIKTFNREIGNRIRDYQVIQRSLNQLEVSLVMDAPLSDSEALRLREVIAAQTGYRFQVSFHYPAFIPKGSGGKSERFRCELS